MAKNPGVDAAAASASLGFVLQDRQVWTKELRSLIKKDCSIDRDISDEKRLRDVIGKAVRQLRGKAPAKDVAEYVKSRLQQEVLQ